MHLAKASKHRSSSVRPAPADLLQTAQSLCAKRGARLTELRQTLFNILVRATQPLTAYELIPLLEKEMARAFAPPSIYRSLEFLLAQRLVARIESRNAYIACVDPVHEHTCIFFVCAKCGEVQEVAHPSVDRLVGGEAEMRGFRIDRRIVELEGLCAHCAVDPDHCGRPSADKATA